MTPNTAWPPGRCAVAFGLLLTALETLYSVFSLHAQAAVGIGDGRASLGLMHLLVSPRGRAMTIALTAALLLVGGANADENGAMGAPEDAVPTMNAVLVQADFSEFYDSHCHKHLRDQLSREEFVEYMQTTDGKAIIDLFAAVAAAIEEGKGEGVLIAQPQEAADEYEFILVEVRNGPRRGRQWHLEIQQEDGRWKLTDTD